MNCTFTTDDVALYLLVANHPLSKERAILHDLWVAHRRLLDAPGIEAFPAFQRHVRKDAIKYQMTDQEMDELSLLMQGSEFAFELDFAVDEQQIIERYFKLIKLSLIAQGTGAYRKIKLRRLLKAFGYKRRSRQLVDEVQHAIAELGLTTWQRGYVPCSIADVRIDDMIMIRLNDGDVGFIHR